MNSDVPKCRLLDHEKTVDLLQYFHGEKTGWVQVGDKNWLFPHRYIEQGPGFFKFKAKPTDVWVMSYPRSGTTWVQELVWLVVNNMDYITANNCPLSERFPFLEFSMFNHPALTKEFVELNKGDSEKEELCKKLAEPGYIMLEKMTSPRFIKSHFPLSLLPNVLDSGCKIVYIARNPKDVAVSYYKLNKAFKTQGFVGNFTKFWNYFRNDLTPWSPYFEHLKEAWDNRNNENLLFLFYEELQEDLTDVIIRIANFFGKSYSDTEIEKLKEHLNIKNFRRNPMVNSQELKDCGIIYQESEFVRNGVTGNWKQYFDKELEADANDWIKKNLYKMEPQYSYLLHKFI